MDYFQEPIGPDPKYPCGICRRNIHNNHRFIRCTVCNFKIHIKCNRIDPNTYKKLTDYHQVCIKYKENAIPFQTLSDDEFCSIATRGVNKDFNDFSSIFPSNTSKAFFKEINITKKDLIEQNMETCEMNCNYIDIENFQYSQKKSNISLFHSNIASISKHKEELEIILSLLEFKFDFIGITESKIKKNSSPIIDIGIEGYNHYSTQTEGEKRGFSSIHIE